ncbi:hypothetical protein P4O66_002959 [Electrophorus voltai]|uniref:Uncharacterized protein n=1 Tax=Electrophorus voltai TaxID=2609070 RepID=A0AAD8YTD6_9TELE|nr:hypothetical protein P4O66_002959 [Electrophorus voltai]
MKGSPISDTGIPEVEVNDTRSTNDTAVPFQFHSDNSDLSDQEKESVQVSKGAAPVDLNLRPEPFETDLDCACSPETAQVYPEVLPAPLKCLDFTPGMSSTAGPEGQQRLLSDPCLAPMVARLMELERLQAATVQKERVKPARSCPATANTGTRNSSRLRKGDLPGSRQDIADASSCKTPVSS